ncbi:MAG: PrpF domain-containing protein [Oscillospiraceae bacterium]
MKSEVIGVNCSIVRGGTSKGIFINANELPADPQLRDKYILEIFGSPDVRQIDGLGGADVLTSKLAIIGPSTRKDADVDYTFGQVSFVDAKVDYNSNCGNISAGVGPYAIDHGLVKAVEPFTEVRIHQVNTNSIIVAKVEVRDGKPLIDGDLHIDGVPTTGSTIELDFSDSVGSITGKLLPTEKVVDLIKTDDGNEYQVSIVDAAIPTVFINANALNMLGTETPAEIEGNLALMKKIEEIRGRCAQMIGLTKDWHNSSHDCPYAPFFAIVSNSADYRTFDGKDVSGKDIDLVSRLLFMQKMHKTHPGTGTVCMSTAARIPGSIVYDVLSDRAKSNKKIIIGHPAGIIPVVSELEIKDNQYILHTAAILRTARIIMDGTVYVRKSNI